MFDFCYNSEIPSDVEYGVQTVILLSLILFSFEIANSNNICCLISKAPSSGTQTILFTLFGHKETDNFIMFITPGVFWMIWECFMVKQTVIH